MCIGIQTKSAWPSLAELEHTLGSREMLDISAVLEAEMEG